MDGPGLSFCIIISHYCIKKNMPRGAGEQHCFCELTRILNKQWPISVQRIGEMWLNCLFVFFFNNGTSQIH